MIAVSQIAIASSRDIRMGNGEWGMGSGEWRFAN
jgi:hypothetical protein